MAEINTSVPAGLQLVPSPRRSFARKDLAWDYPVSRSRVKTFYYYYSDLLTYLALFCLRSPKF